MGFSTDCLGSAGFTRTREHIQGVLDYFTSRCKNVQRFSSYKRLYISLIMLYGTINIVTHPVIFYVYFHWHIIYGAIF